MHTSLRRSVPVLIAASCIAALSPGGASSPASAACKPRLSIPKQGDAGAAYTFKYVACAKGKHVFTLVYLDGSPGKKLKRGMTRGTRTITVRSVGSHSFLWSGSASVGRYRGSMKLPNGTKVSSTGTLAVVCSAGRRADPENFPEC